MTGAGWTWDRALCGIVPPAISPLDAGREVDEAAIGVLVEHVLRAGCSGLFVLGGQPRRLGDFDIAGCAMEMRRGEEVGSRGNGRACLGNPLNAAVWLADVMVRCGRPLQAGVPSGLRRSRSRRLSSRMPIGPL